MMIAVHPLPVIFQPRGNLGSNDLFSTIKIILIRLSYGSSSNTNMKWQYNKLGLSFNSRTIQTIENRLVRKELASQK